MNDQWAFNFAPNLRRPLAHITVRCAKIVSSLLIYSLLSASVPGVCADSRQGHERRPNNPFWPRQYNPYRWGYKASGDSTDCQVCCPSSPSPSPNSVAFFSQSGWSHLSKHDNFHSTPPKSGVNGHLHPLQRRLSKGETGWGRPHGASLKSLKTEREVNRDGGSPRVRVARVRGKHWPLSY